MKVIYNNKEVGDNKNNYNRLTDKPLINSTELVGNITLNDINVYSKEEVKRLISSTRSVKVALVLPSPVTPNTTYYIGPDMNGIYTVYLTDSSDPINVFSIGTTSFGKYYSGDGINVTDPQNVVLVLTDSESVIINSEGLLEARPVFEKMLPFQGATSTADGTKGIVPKPATGDQNKFLFGDATWKNIIDIVYPVNSIFIAYGNAVSPNTLFPGTTWATITNDRALKTVTGSGGQNGTSGMPNVKGEFPYRAVGTPISCGNAYSNNAKETDSSMVITSGGSFSDDNKPLAYVNVGTHFNKSNDIYGKSNIVQPPAVTIMAYRRTA